MLVKCENCKEKFNKKPSVIKKTKHNFCSKECCYQQKDIDGEYKEDKKSMH